MSFIKEDYFIQSSAGVPLRPPTTTVSKGTIVADVHSQGRSYHSSPSFQMILWKAKAYAFSNMNIFERQ